MAIDLALCRRATRTLTLFDGNMQYIRYLSPINLDEAYTILESIGYPDKAEKLLKAFIQEFSDTPGMFD
jgi:hypothetical protein